MNIFKSILNGAEFWSLLSGAGFDAVFYFFFAALGTLLFLIRMGISLFLGGDTDIELDPGVMDADVDFDTDHAFNILSIQSILAFFMGAGWMGLIARFDWELSRIASGFAAVAFGLFLMSFSAWLMLMIRKLEKSTPYDIKTAIGHTGRVYMSLPAKGEGAGQVEVSISGRKKIMPAISTADAIDSFTSVTVVDVRDDETLIVEVHQD